MQPSKQNVGRFVAGVLLDETPPECSSKNGLT
jgi:hypothetical protein